MKKIIFSIVLIYMISVSLELPLKKWATDDPNANICLIEVIVAPLVIPMGIVFGLIHQGSKTCVLGCNHD